MTYYCKYHPLEAASWHCPTCHVLYCEQCSPDLPGNDPGVAHNCVQCAGELKNLGGAHRAKPFWQRMLDFLRYPLSPAALVLLAAGAAFPLLPMLSGAVFFVTLAVYCSVVCAFGFVALEQAATGQLESVGFSRLTGENSHADVGGKLGLVVALGAGAVMYIVLGSLKSHFWGSMLAAAEMAVLPAIIMSVAIDRSVNTGLSADSIGSVLKGLGPMYAAVVLISLLLLGAVQSLISLFSDILPFTMGLSVTVVGYAYLLLVLMVMCGYILFQFQAPLNYTASSVSGRTRRSRTGVVDWPAIQVDVLVKEGNYAKAIAVLKAEANRKGATLTAHDRYNRLMTAVGDEEGLRKHADQYFRVLLEGNRDTQVLGLMREFIRRDSRWRPEDPDICLDVAQAFVNLGEYKMALHMVNGLHKDTPHYVRLPEAYLLAARILNERLNMPAKALDLMDYLEGRFRANPKVFAEVQAFKRGLEGRL